MQIARRDFLGLAGSAAVYPSAVSAAPAAINMLHLGAVGLSNLLLHVAHRNNFFEKHAVAVRLVPVTGTGIPELTEDNPVGHIGAPAAILRAVRGTPYRIVASLDSGRLFNQLVVSPKITKPDHLKGKRMGARVKGAALWIHTVIALEKLGLDFEKDNIQILPIGDPDKVMQALEAGEIEGAVLSAAQSRQLEAKGFPVLLDLSTQSVYGAVDAVVATPKFAQDYPHVVQAIVTSLIEATAFALSSKGKAATIEVIKSELKVTSDAAAEGGLEQLARIAERKPYPAVERLRNMQRVMRMADPRSAEIDVATLVDDRFVKAIDTAGLIDRAYAAQ